MRDLLLSSDAPKEEIHLDLPNISNEAFEILLNFMYTGHLNLSCRNIGGVYRAARKLGMEQPLKLCTDVLTGKSDPIMKAVYIYTTAKMLGEEDIAKRNLQIMARHFERIACTKEFLSLTCVEVCEYLSCDELAVRSEVIVYLSALKWLCVRFLEREMYIGRVLSCVRFSLMSLNEMIACHSPPILPGITEKQEIKNMLLQGTCYIAAKTLNKEKQFPQYASKPRQLLLDRAQMILWDPEIFNAAYYKEYRKETAATMIQASFRGLKARLQIENEGRKRNAAAENRQSLFEPSAQRQQEEKQLPLPGEEATTSNADNQDNKILPTGKEKGKESQFVDPLVEDLKPVNNQRHRKKVCSVPQEKTGHHKCSRVSYRHYSSLKKTEASKSVSSGSGYSGTASTTSSDQEPPDSMSGKDFTSDEMINVTTTNGKLSILSKAEAEKPSTRDVIIVMGGYEKNKEDNDISKGGYMYSYFPALNEWSVIGSMNPVRHHFIAVLYEGNIYCIGGCSDDFTAHNGDATGDALCFRFNLATKEWSRIADLNHSRIYHGAALVMGRIYVAGGKDEKGQILDSLEYYVSEEDYWQLLRVNLESPKFGIGACCHENQFWIVGGITKDMSKKECVLREVECYDPLDNMIWHNMPKLPSACGFTTLMVVEDELYVIGGVVPSDHDTESFQSIADILVLKEDVNQWISTTPLPTPRHSVSAVIYGQALFIMSSLSTSDNEGLDQVLVYNDLNNCFRQCSSLPDGLFETVSVTVPNMHIDSASEEST